ncbi:hypothetical protein B5S31_g5293 [[Candida] boidinii]|nr:hypothetical protein B5S29_g4755 [[Candida] boidinii]OWB75401.1 hypothetical protein B5S31_g5293 [[Candida] boidinii]
MKGSNYLPLNQSDLIVGSSSNSHPGNSNNNNTNNNNNNKLKCYLVIRFATNIPDVELLVNLNNLRDVSTGWVRQQIRFKIPKESENKRLKLIHNGRVLLNHSDLEKEIRKIQKLRQLADAEDNKNEDNEEGGGGGDENGDEPIKLYIHCLIGEELTPEELKEEELMDNKQPERSTAPAVRGFDRLLSQGFSQQDVFDLRRQFQEIHGSSLQNNSEDAIRDLEDRWIDSTVNNEIDEFTGLGGNSNNQGILNNNQNQNGIINGNGNNGSNNNNRDANLDLLIGVALGFFLGIFSLFLLKIEIGGIFNKRTKIYIITGVFVNLSFGVLRSWTST